MLFLSFYSEKELRMTFKNHALFSEYSKSKGWSRNPVAVTSITPEKAKQKYDIFLNCYYNDQGAEQNLKILNEMTQRLNRKGIRVIVVQPPFSQVLNDCLDSTITITLQRDLDHLDSNINSINLSENELFKDSLFSDSDHLNYLGASRFSKIINTYISSLPRESQSSELHNKEYAK
jgi:hypothetical protein